MTGHLPKHSTPGFRHWLKIVGVAMCVGGLPLAGAAEVGEVELRERIQALNAKSFNDKKQAIEALGELRDPRSLPVFEALVGGHVYVWDKAAVVIAKRAESRYVVTDAISGERLAEVGKKSLKKIRVNNRLRGIIRGIVGQLALFSADAQARMAAVDAVIKSPTSESLTLLRHARERETDEQVRAHMETGIATLELNAQDPALRMAAIAVLAETSSPDFKVLLEQRLLVDAQGVPREPDPVIRAAVEQAVGDIAGRMRLLELLENLFFGISLGSVLLLAAIGLAITFGVMGVINMAHGEMIMLGAYTTFVIQEIFRHFVTPDLFGLYLLAAVPAAFLVAGAFGLLIERSCIRFLYGRPLETLLATWGISLILQQTTRSVFGANNREVANPEWISGSVELLGNVSVTFNRVCIVLFSVLVVALLAAFIRYSRFGLNMRAVTQNRAMASSMGIRTGRVDALTFALGSGIAGIAGMALSQISNVSPNLGQNFIVDSFMVVVFGGVGSLWGTVVGAFSLGIVNKFLEPVSGAILGKIVVLGFIILFIQLRPRGLFALKGRAAED